MTIVYSGVISSEYEGWHWNYWESPFDIVRAEQQVQRAAALNAGSRIVTTYGEARAVQAATLASAAPDVGHKRRADH